MNKKELIKILSSLVTPSKAAKIETVAKARCHTVQVLLENISDRGNENAITRTMDGLGIHQLHRLHNKKDHMMRHINPSRTDKGSKQWMNIHNWSNTRDCVEYIKSNGFILAGTDCNGSVLLEEIDLKRKRVVFGFGNEGYGMSQELLEQCDVTFKLPMRGFVTSYNVTVSVAMTLYHMVALNKIDPQLSNDVSSEHELEDTIINMYSSILGPNLVQALIERESRVRQSNFRMV